MYGHIKQVIELRLDKIEGEEPQLCPFDTTSFDKSGNPVETKLGIKQRLCLLITYKTKYDEHDKRLETIVDDGNRTIYKFNGDGYVVKSEYYTTSWQLLDYNTYQYNSAGEIMESDRYGSLRDPKPIKIKFEYDLDGFMSSVHDGRWQWTFRYLSMDSKGNWTKRIAKRGDKIDTTTRKITYY